jgi:hypothetical protein
VGVVLGVVVLVDEFEEELAQVAVVDELHG